MAPGAGPPRRTVTLDHGRDRASAETAAYLTLAFRPGAPRAEAVRFRLRPRAICAVGRAGRVALAPGGDRIDIDDETISERHFTVTRRDGRWLLCDLGSKNGTLVNGVRVREQVAATLNAAEYRAPQLREPKASAFCSARSK